MLERKLAELIETKNRLLADRARAKQQQHLVQAAMISETIKGLDMAIDIVGGAS